MTAHGIDSPPSAPPPGFAGHIALVTGGAAGIGAAVCRRLHAQGAEVVVVDQDEAEGKAVAASIGSARFIHSDVADSTTVDAAVAMVMAKHGRLDVVVHAAGVDDPAAKQRISDSLVHGDPVDVTAGLDDESWRRVLSVNLDGTFNVLRSAVRAMRPAGSGAIVLIGSSAAFDAPIGYPHYSAAKAGVHALAQAVAKEVIAWGIRVNVVAPGPTDTGMAARTPEALRSRFMAEGSGRYATPDEIAEVVLFLAGSGASNVVGAVVLANGGLFTA